MSTKAKALLYTFESNDQNHQVLKLALKEFVKIRNLKNDNVSKAVKKASKKITKKLGGFSNIGKDKYIFLTNSMGGDKAGHPQPTLNRIRAAFLDFVLQKTQYGLIFGDPSIREGQPIDFRHRYAEAWMLDRIVDQNQGARLIMVSGTENRDNLHRIYSGYHHRAFDNLTPISCFWNNVSNYIGDWWVYRHFHYKWSQGLVPPRMLEDVLCHQSNATDVTVVTMVFGCYNQPKLWIPTNSRNTLRDQLMIDNADTMVAFHNGESPLASSTRLNFFNFITNYQKPAWLVTFN